MWGAKIIVEGMGFVPVYCKKQGKPGACEDVTPSHCEQGTCQLGQCFFEGSCYYIKSNELEGT